ncbi:MAG: helix-turn-helix transcriptional regulator [Calditrichaceae bacterium]|jgi:AraC-like DNA-binding protein
MSLPLLDIILLLAAIQGIFLAVLIIHKYSSLYANRFLSAYMFLYSVLFVNLILGDLGLFSKVPYLLFFHIGIPFLIPPLHYLYAKNLIYQHRPFRLKWFLHLVPLFLFEILFIIFYSVDKQGIIPTSSNQFKNSASVIYSLFNWSITIQGLTYIIFTLLLIKNYSKNLKKIFSSIEKYQLDWLRNISLILAFVLIFFLLENVFLLYNISISHYFSLTSYLAGFAVYLIGYLGLSKSEIFSEIHIHDSLKKLSENEHSLPLQIQPVNDRQKYAKSGLSVEKANLYKQKLIRIMENDRLYKNCNLTLTQLAKAAGISMHNVSEVINTQFDKSFFDFVNDYRIEEAKKQLADPQKVHLKILALAYEAGFNSKASFNGIFKKYTNMTPSEYRNKVINKI